MNFFTVSVISCTKNYIHLEFRQNVEFKEPERVACNIFSRIVRGKACAIDRGNSITFAITVIIQICNEKFFFFVPYPILIATLGAKVINFSP